MTLREALVLGVQHLSAAGIEGAARDARALLAEVAGLKPSMVTLEGDMTLDEPARYEALLERRAGGEPVSKILGRRQFWGREFRVTQDTLDPRPETESLIAAALELGPAARFADLGTGSGIIAVTLLAEWDKAQAVATDISAAALDVAHANAVAHSVMERLETVKTDGVWYPSELEEFDMILSNPPYISEAEMAGLSREVRDHDPVISLTPGGDGLNPYRALARDARVHLAPGGYLLVEIGWKQGPDVAGLFEAAGLSGVRILPDLDGRDRVVLGQNC